MAARVRTARLVVAPLLVLGAATLALPWWTARAPVLLVASAPALPADSWAGWETAGWPRVLLVGVLALAVACTRASGPALAAGGAALTAAGIVVLVGWGASDAPWPWLAAAVGAVVLAVAVRGLVTLLVAALAAAVTVIVPGNDPTTLTAGPYVRLAGLAAGPVRSGDTVLPLPADRLVTVDGATAVATPEGIVAVDGGRARVVARSPDAIGPLILGVGGDRVARWVAADRLLVTSLRPDDPVEIEVYAVAAAGPVGTDGSLWLRADGDPPGAIRFLPLDLYQGRQRLAATYLPVLTIGLPAGTTPVELAGVLPVGGGGVRFVTRGGAPRLERIAAAPAGGTIDVLAGGLDAACGLSGSARAAHLAGTGPLAADRDGGIWFVDGVRLLRVDPAGVLRAVADPLPGRATALVVTPDGALDMALADGPGGPGLWRLPAAADRLTALPPTPAGCVPDPPPVGPPVAFVPIGTTGSERDGVPLDVAGRWVSQARGRVAVVAGGMRTPLGDRPEGSMGSVWPDGSGGVWWLDEGSAPGLRTPVHARPGQPVERFPDVPAAADAALVPDLGGRPPLLAGPAGLAPLVAGTAVPAVAGPIGAGVVAADGRGWVLADGRLVAFAGDTVVGTVVDAGERRADPTPAAVQLAKGVPPAQLAIAGAHVGLDAGGRVVVVCADGVVLRVDDAGGVTVVAQDPLLIAPVTVAGGLVQDTDGTLLRVDLPG